ncbi:MAG TPA: potassium transporter TrkG, partial [Steroidobacteraceae bacterium]|nr:potassium transporter TrkG [Steroidobacteraceae bacterium]
MRSLLGVLNAVGSLLALFALYYALPLLTAFFYREAALRDFALSAAITFAIGMGLKLATQRFTSELKPRDGYLLVTISWLSIAALATIPLMRQIPELSFTDAFFETMSGLSTTGATILTGIDALPHAVNLWREALSWLGGMGIIVMAVAILPLLGVGGMQMYRAESPGAVKDARLTSRIIQTAKLLWMVYVGITALCALSLWLAGMSGFDAICHAFATVGLGGFSTHDASIGYFNSPAIELVLIVFMLLAAMNFSTHFTALRRGSFQPYARDPEVRWLLVWTIVSCFGVAAYVRVAHVYPDYFTALRYVGFNLISIATTSGFVNTDYGTWPVFAPMWMLFLSCVCASSGSTGGGVKIFRSLVLIKQSMREM